MEKWEFEGSTPEEQQKELEKGKKAPSPPPHPPPFPQPTEDKGSGKRKRGIAWTKHQALIAHKEREESDRKFAKLEHVFYERGRREAAGDEEEQDAEDPLGDVYENPSGYPEYWEYKEAEEEDDAECGPYEAPP